MKFFFTLLTLILSAMFGTGTATINKQKIAMPVMLWKE